jgi:hypothetical protein
MNPLAQTVIGECILWEGCKSSKERGRLRRNGKAFSLGRSAWIQKFGPIIGTTRVGHKCGNLNCINPDHLFVRKPPTPEEKAAKYRIYTQTYRAKHPEKARAILENSSRLKKLRWRANRNNEAFRLQYREKKARDRRRHGQLERSEYVRLRKKGELSVPLAFDLSVIRVIKGLSNLGCVEYHLGKLFSKVQTVRLICIEKHWRHVDAAPESEVREVIISMCRSDTAFLVRWLQLTLFLEVRTLTTKFKIYENRENFLEFCHSVCKAV